MNLFFPSGTNDPFAHTQVAAGLRIALIGAGALGSEVARRLIATDARDVLVIDPDRLETPNFALSALYTAAGPDHLGRLKADLVSELAAPLNWQSEPAEIADVGLGRIAEVDILLTAPDSTLARLEAAYAARLLRVPMIDGAIHADGSSAGRVAFYPASKTAACYSCGLTAARRADLLTYASSPAIGCRPPASHAPMSGTTALIEAVATAMLEATNSLTGPQAWSRIIHASAASALTPLPLNAACPWHSLPGTLRPIPEHLPLHTLWQSRADRDLLFDLPWPICLRARCRACGLSSKPLARLARVRRTLACPACGIAGTLEPVETLSSLAPEDDSAQRTALQLGLPRRHLLSARPRLHWLPSASRPATGFTP